MFVSVFYWESGRDPLRPSAEIKQLWLSGLRHDCAAKRKKDRLMGNNTIHKEEFIKEETRKSVGLRHSGRCHGSSHAVSHTHTLSSLYMLFRPTQSHTLQCHSHSVSNQTAHVIRKHTALLDCLKNKVFFYTECFSGLFDERMSCVLLQYAGAQINNIFYNNKFWSLGLCISNGDFRWLHFSSLGGERQWLSLWVVIESLVDPICSNTLLDLGMQQDCVSNLIIYSND